MKQIGRYTSQAFLPRPTSRLNFRYRELRCALSPARGAPPVIPAAQPFRPIPAPWPPSAPTPAATALCRSFHRRCTLHYGLS
eukprot:5295312-Pleurochrysis_carterae.AAC.3